MAANNGEELSGAQGRTAPIKKNQSLTSEWDSKFFQEFLRLFADGVPPEPHCQFSDQRGYVGQCNVLRNWQGSVFVIVRQWLTFGPSQKRNFGSARIWQTVGRTFSQSPSWAVTAKTKGWPGYPNRATACPLHPMGHRIQKRAHRDRRRGRRLLRR